MMRNSIFRLGGCGQPRGYTQTWIATIHLWRKKAQAESVRESGVSRLSRAC